MAKLEIRLNEQGKEKQGKRGHLPPLQFSDYDILIDGQEPSLMTEFSLKMSTETFNECTITFNVDELEVDAEALATLQAVAKVDKPAVTIDGETFDEITKKGRIHEYGKAAAEAKGIDRKMLDAVKNAPVQLIEGDLYRANKIKDDLLSIVDELLKYKFTDEIGLPLHLASPFQQLAEIANYHIDTDRYFYRNGTKVVEA
ncbi:hypothetical protein ACQGRJ_21605 [Bacillus atrophaeus]|uniref:hypothetical protein n=1 Tax=Bacillus atrophaeus TaxID=1452 RepID=UPI003CF0E9DE